MRRLLTICGRIHHNKSGVYIGPFLSVLEDHGVRVASQTIRGLVKMNIVRSTFQRPQRCNTSTATADNGNPFSVLHFEVQDSSVTGAMTDDIIWNVFE